ACSGFWSVLVRFWSGLCPASGRACRFWSGCPASGRACPAYWSGSASGAGLSASGRACPAFWSGFRLWSGLSGFWFWSGLSGFWSGSGLSDPLATATRRPLLRLVLVGERRLPRPSHGSDTPRRHTAGSSELARSCRHLRRLHPPLPLRPPAATAAPPSPLLQATEDEELSAGRSMSPEEDSADDEDDDDLPMVDADVDEDDDCLQAAASATTASANSWSAASSAVDAPCENRRRWRCAADVAALAATFRQLRRICRLHPTGRRQLAEWLRRWRHAASRRSRARILVSCLSSGAAEGEPAGLPYGEAAGGRETLSSRAARPQQTGADARQRQNRHRSGLWATGCVFAPVVPTARTARCLLCAKSGRPQLARRPSAAAVATRGTPRGRPAGPADGPRCELTDPGPACPLLKRLLGAAGNQEEPERRTAERIRVLLAWAGSHFDDFAASPGASRVLLRLDQLLGAAAGGGGGRRAAAAAARLHPSLAALPCRAPEPPLAAQGATAVNSVRRIAELDDDIDQVDAGSPAAPARVPSLNGARVSCGCHACSSCRRRCRVASSFRLLQGPAAQKKLAAAVNDAMANDADEVDEVRGFRQWGSACWMVSVSPGLVVRPSGGWRRVVQLPIWLCGGGGGGCGGGGVRLYLAGPSEPV
uniref:BLM10_mid domain-containing protein n=1 Tax=Macrostomum lignano TaxID=282301 RepID=A0A1I8FBT7_9PLAT